VYPCTNHPTPEKTITAQLRNGRAQRKSRREGRNYLYFDQHFGRVLLFNLILSICEIKAPFIFVARAGKNISQKPPAQSPAEQKENKKEIVKFIIKSISKMKRAVGSSACMPVRRPAPLSAAHHFNAPSTSHSGHFAISPSASGWVVTSRRGLHVSAPVGAAKVNPRNMNQAVRKDMQSIEAVRKRHDELRKQKQLEQEEAAGVRHHHHPFPSRLLCRACVCGREVYLPVAPLPSRSRRRSKTSTCGWPTRSWPTRS
jgi:hypothetical protein